MIANQTYSSISHPISSLETNWSLIEAAAQADPDARDVFARRYIGPIRTYLSARWRNSSYIRYLDDAVQEVFLDCFRTGGPLERFDGINSSGFRAYLYGIVRITARKVESRVCAQKRISQGSNPALEEIQVDESSLSTIYNRSWALCMIQQATQRQLDKATTRGGTALRRVELLQLRFKEGLPIREIASRWNVDSRTLHHEYARARAEFKANLLEVIAFHHPGAPAEVERECKELADLLR